MSAPSSLQRRLAALPAVHILLKHPDIAKLIGHHGHTAVTGAIRETLQQARILISRDMGEASTDVETLASRVLNHFAGGDALPGRPVVNASGILLHPAAGMAPLMPSALQAMRDALTPVAQTYESRVRELMAALTGAEDALVVHTPQAALWLIADTLGRGKELVISRAHLGAGPDRWSIPEVLHRCAGRVIEVGATNKTHLSDYRNAISPHTGVVLIVRPATYALRGFVEEPAMPDLIRLGHDTGAPVFFDLGHAPLTPLNGPARRFHPAVSEVIQQGAALAAARGDGLAGGPPSGLIAGRQTLIDTLLNHPLYAMIKPSLPVLAGWEATLQAFRAHGAACHPLAGWLNEPPESVRTCAERCLARLTAHPQWSGSIEVIDHTAYLTTSCLPAEAFASAAIAVRPVSGEPQTVADLLYRRDPAILASIEADRIVLDFKTVDATQEDAIYQAIVDML